MKKEEPSKAQKRKFVKGFFWGKIEHKLEGYTTILLLIGVILQIVGLATRKWSWLLFAFVLFILALLFRVGAGIAHRIEKFYMDKLRFGKWRNQK